MVMFFKPQKQQTDRYFDLSIESLDGHCIGIGRKEDRTWFVPNTMIGDIVKVEKKDVNKRIGHANVQKYITKSKQRCSEFCPHTNKCGGCSCQFIPQEIQIQAKIDGLKQTFSKNVGVKLANPDNIVSLNSSNYRRTCRLSTYFDNKTKILHLGFREKNSHAIYDIDQCPIMKQELSNLIVPLRNFLNKLSIKSAIGHIELTSVDNGIFMLIRITKSSLCNIDIELFQNFCNSHLVNGFIQTDESIKKIFGSRDYGEYTVNKIKYLFRPNDFIQINADINNEIINQSIKYLNLSSTDKVLDLFCGIGNFSLQIAKHAKIVYGVELVNEMVQQAEINAKNNDISNAEFIQLDLTTDLSENQFLKEKYDAVLLDPGRKGAAEVCNFFCKHNIPKIVYVSCNPITATRDFNLLVQNGYKILGWSIFDMFPNTEHVETVVLLSRN